MPKKPAVPNPAALSLFSPEILDDGTATLTRLREDCRNCQACGLYVTRKNPVFGEGRATRPVIAFVGEGPGEQEDLAGRPFIGKSGQLLTQMIHAMGLTREEVYICNTVACRPPSNRAPEDDEIKACQPFLLGQLRAVRPQVIVTLGGTAAKALIKGGKALNELRGRWWEWEAVPVRPSFHPAYLLRKPVAKAEAWKDLQAVLKKLGIELPETAPSSESSNTP